MSEFSRAIASGSMAKLTFLNVGLNQIGDEGIKAFSSAIGSGSLAALTNLRLWENKIGDEGMKAFSIAIANGALASLKSLVVPSPHEKNPELKAMCAERSIELV